MENVRVGATLAVARAVHEFKFAEGRCENGRAFLPGDRKGRPYAEEDRNRVTTIRQGVDHSVSFALFISASTRSMMNRLRLLPCAEA